MAGIVRTVIVWVNGTFGAGKTTVSSLVSQRIPGLRLFDPEHVGYLLRAHLADHPVRDFRDWESWRILVPVVADELVRFSGQGLVAPQTVLEEDYWDDLVVDTTDLSAEQVAERVCDAVGSRANL